MTTIVWRISYRRIKMVRKLMLKPKRFYKIVSIPTVILTILGTYFVLQGINFASSLSLLCGAINVRMKISINNSVDKLEINFQRRPKLLIAWLVSQAILIIFWILGSVLLSDIYVTIYAFFWVYFWICVYSLYQKMNLEHFQQQSSYYGMRAV